MIIFEIGKFSWFRKGACKNITEGILQETLVSWFEELLNLSLYVEAGLLVCHFTFHSSIHSPVLHITFCRMVKTGCLVYDLHSSQKTHMYTKACISSVFVLSRANVAHMYVLLHTQPLGYQKWYKPERKVDPFALHPTCLVGLQCSIRVSQNWWIGCLNAVTSSVTPVVASKQQWAFVSMFTSSWTLFI